MKTSIASLLNVVDILSTKRLVMEVAAVRKAEELWGGEAAAPDSAVEAEVDATAAGVAETETSEEQT